MSYQESFLQTSCSTPSHHRQNYQGKLKKSNHTTFSFVKEKTIEEIAVEQHSLLTIITDIQQVSKRVRHIVILHRVVHHKVLIIPF